MGDEYEEATPAAKLAIANYFIMSSPPGQVDDVLVDVAKLVGDDSVLNNSELNKMMGAYNLESYATCTTEGGKIICCPAGKVSEDSFVDPSTGAVMNVDHRKREATPSGSEQSISDAKVKAFRDAIEKDLSAYLSNQYKEGKAVCGVYASDDGTITCVVSAMNKKLSSFWSGSWRSTFSLNVKEGGTVPMNGHVKIHVHYFEDGNVQLHAEREKKSNVNVTDEKSTAAAVVDALNKWESEYQSNIEEMYVDIHQNTFKQMRRFLPITKNPMNWNTQAHSLADELHKK